MKYEFTNEDLKNWFHHEELKVFSSISIVKKICEIRNLDFNECSNIDVERSALYAPKLVFDYNIKNNTSKMKEEFKITGKGALHGKEFGILKLDEEIDFKKYITSDNVTIKKIVYDPKLKQYCVDGQWIIPFGYDSKIETLLNETMDEVKELKEFFVRRQSFEPASKTRDIEKNLLNMKMELTKLEEMRLRC